MIYWSISIAITLFSYSVHQKTDYQYAYNVYGVGCAEVEIDVLTGQPQILRVDILYDCGDRYVCVKL